MSSNRDNSRQAALTRRALVLVVAGGTALASAAWGQPYAITRWAVAGGGSGFTGAGVYTLGGTAGQSVTGLVAAGPYALRSGFWGASGPSLVGVGDPGTDPPAPPAPGLPAAFRVLPAAPNPLTRSTRIGLELPVESAVEVVVHDLLGGRVRTLAADRFAAGRHGLGWDGRDDRGTLVAPGLYFARIRLGTIRSTLKLVVTR